MLLDGTTVVHGWRLLLTLGAGMWRGHAEKIIGCHIMSHDHAFNAGILGVEVNERGNVFVREPAKMRAWLVRHHPRRVRSFDLAHALVLLEGSDE